jgi:putative nucleotidyltransferase with HDIG domain
MRGVKIIEISDINMFRAAWKCFEDYRSKLEKLPSSLSGNFHPKDEDVPGGLIKHTEKICWLIKMYKEKNGLSNLSYDILMTCALFHDIGKADKVNIKLRLELQNGKLSRKYLIDIDKKDYEEHPQNSADIAEKYLKAEGVQQSIIDQIKGIIVCHMNPFDNSPQPKTDLERLFSFFDYLSSRRELELNIYENTP